MSTSLTSALAPPESAAKKIGIFVSHKKEDRLAALQIKNKFEECGAGRLDVHVSELIPKGQLWDPVIHQWLKESAWLLLLYTGPGVEWDWCLYETGFFAGFHDNSTKRLVCLHRAGVDLPGPLQAWQAATEENCDGLLNDIFREAPCPGAEPLNPKISDKTLKDLSHEIMDAIIDQPKPVVLTPYLELLVEERHLNELRMHRTLAKGITVTADVKAREIFGVPDNVGGKALCWGDIAAGLERTRQAGWIRSLSDSIRCLCQKQSVSTTFPVVYSVTSDSRRRWRPILYCVQSGGGAEVFRIVLSEILPEDDPRPTDPRLDHCMALMKMARMLRFGLIEKYRPLVRQFQTRQTTGSTVTPEELDEGLGSLPAAIDRIETEAMNSGVQSLDSVIELFGAGGARESKKLKDWTAEWVGYRTQLADGVATRDLEKVSAALEGIRKVNGDSFRLIVHRYVELIDELDASRGRTARPRRVTRPAATHRTKGRRRA